MSRKVVTNLDLNKNQIQNVVVQPLAAAPANPADYQIYANSTDGIIYQWDPTLEPAAWRPVGAVYNQAGETGAVIVGLDKHGNVTTKNVTELTLTGYAPVQDGYVAAGDTIQKAIAALDEAVKNAVAGGGEVNQNAFSNVKIPQQSTNAETEVTGQGAAATIAAGAKTDTLTIASGDKWTHVNADTENKTVNIGHAFSGATAGTYGAADKVPTVTVDKAGHVTGVVEKTITPEAIGADKSGAAAEVLGKDTDAATAATVYGAKKAAAAAQAAAEAAAEAAGNKVASVGATANKGIAIEGTITAPTVGIKLDPKQGNAASLSEAGLLVEIPDAAEYTIAKLTAAQDGYLASYQLQKDGNGVGAVINIPKDYLVKDVAIKDSTGEGDPSGFPAGTKYIDFTVNTYTDPQTPTESHIYLNVQDLVDLYTAGDGIDISDQNVISVKVVAANGLSVGADGVKMALATDTAAGAMPAADHKKLGAMDEGATANTITLNGTETKTPSFYAPAGGGTAGQILVAGGDKKAPTWQDMPEKFHKYTAVNEAITAAGGAFTWTITAATHGIANPAMMAQLYEVATGAQVLADVTVSQTNYDVTVTINDTEKAGTLNANTYRVVLFG